MSAEGTGGVVFATQQLVAVEALCEAERGSDVAVGDDCSRFVAVPVQQLGESRRFVGERVFAPVGAVPLRPQAGEDRRHRRACPR